MKKLNIMVLGISLWAITISLLISNIDLFITLLLIGSLIFLEISDFFLSKKNKEYLKIVIYILASFFALVVLNKIYTIIK
ncbi:conserved hypothetical protein [Methanococcus vannielii SB]|uniref:DUF3953 domain-containing protein n=1 Tax=Methanococcus vannielii (strain ATCC 35089 / DSM 1224 / JCM 13029 / OCM 148 / SB) TaxID=406327 RepID=A6UNM7_METVS|nr:hypothetical protein [Methanococcus vannielii]ABR54099.1 conserved hypothetical protein [Methanococcus vannielii SB]